MKKLISLVLALALVFAVAVASAATITIESKAPATAVDNTSYEYWQVFKATIGTDAVVNEDTGAITTAGTASYYIDSEAMYNALNTDAGRAVFTLTAVPGVSGRYNVTLNSGKGIDDIKPVISTAAVKAAAYANGTFSMDNTTRRAVKDELAIGYYLIESSIGTTLAVQTLSDVEIKEKNDYFTDVKTEDTANVSVGDTVNYTITISIPATVAVGDVITVHDTLDDRLSMNDDIAAVITGTETSVALTDGDKEATSEDFAKKFTVSQDIINAGGVTITYSAVVLNTAVSDTGFINTSFANDSSYKTVPTQVKTYTFNFDLLKTFTGATGDAANYTATFELAKAGTALNLVQSTEDATKYTFDPAGTVTVITIHNNETINVKGLAAGTYTLTEKTTSAGYNLLTEPITVEIIDDTPEDKKSIDTTPAHHVRYKLTSSGEWIGTDTNNQVSVENNSGTTLPSTGGIGTTIFYIVGGMLLVGAAIVLVARRKASEN